MKIPYLEKNPSMTLTVGVLLLFGVIASIAPIVMFWQAEPSQQTNPPIIPETPSTPKPVTALGRIEPKEKVIRLSAPATTQFRRLEKLMVKEGERVQAGQVIALLDNYNSHLANLQQTKEQVKVAKARLAQVKAGAKTGEINAQKAEIARAEVELKGQIATQDAVIARVTAEWQNAQFQCDRYKILYEQGAVASVNSEQECLQEETLKNQVQEVKQNLERIKSAGKKQIVEAQATLDRIAEVRPVDISVAQAEVRQAQSAVVQAESELALAQVRTHFSGHVLKIHAQPGELIGESGVIDLGQTDEMYVVAEVYETDIPRVQVGQKATITSPVIGQELVGQVDKIGWQLGKRNFLGTDPNLDVDAKVIEVKIQLSPAASKKVIKLSNLEVQTQIATK